MEYIETGSEILIAYILNEGLQASWGPRCAHVLYRAAATTGYFLVILYFT